MNVTKFLKDAKPNELLKLYRVLEPKVQAIIDARKLRAALADFKAGRIYHATSGADVIRQCK